MDSPYLIVRITVDVHIDHEIKSNEKSYHLKLELVIKLQALLFW